MSKAILALEMPNKCAECPLSCDIMGDYNKNLCRCYEEYMVNPNSEKRPDWCPLKELPIKDSKMSMIKSIDYSKGLVDGWNSCIDEILGE